MRANAILILIAVVLSLVTFRYKSLDNVSPCIITPGCVSQDNTLGRITIKKQGYPLVYRETITFEPAVQTNFAIVKSEPKGMSVTSIGINTIFWYALLFSITTYVKPQIKTKRPKK